MVLPGRYLRPGSGRRADAAGIDARTWAMRKSGRLLLW
ncbi:hypothetical protein CSB93_4548 [Pseudomonas paraeruginosa]|uniref:Uncharacterized protein n=1 Tax=Pseudomonas paraeruginosa TaxID=2994495 RepID=A0A2R3IWD1_9PSED|nr:hypothetical protein CSB93_4548 [Pseudomonas paraeruginosa]